MTSTKKQPAGLAKLLPIALVALVALGVWILDTGDDSTVTLGESQAEVSASQGSINITQPTFETSDQNQAPDKDEDGANQDTDPPAESVDDGPTFRPVSDLDIVYSSDLPNEAIDTLSLIANGGPYPFDQDNTVFQNREGVLPDQFRGYYHEYTVITPGLSHRGAKRIVAGDDGELYYTDDHYESFSEIGY